MLYWDGGLGYGRHEDETEGRVICEAEYRKHEGGPLRGDGCVGGDDHLRLNEIMRGEIVFECVEVM